MVQAVSQAATDEAEDDDSQGKSSKRMDMVQWFAAFEVEALLRSFNGLAFVLICACLGVGTGPRRHWNFEVCSGMSHLRICSQLACKRHVLVGLRHYAACFYPLCRQGQH